MTSGKIFNHLKPPFFLFVFTLKLIVNNLLCLYYETVKVLDDGHASNLFLFASVCILLNQHSFMAAESNLFGSHHLLSIYSSVFFFINFITFVCVYLCVHATYIYEFLHVEVKGQVARIGSLVSSGVSCESNSSYQAWSQCTLTHGTSSPVPVHIFSSQANKLSVFN